jgi:serine/threonine-protein kinase ULK/ATG1
MGTPHRRVGEWELGASIGSGSYAVVYHARHHATGEEAAVKEINLERLNAKLRQALESEVSILQRIDHQNIVKLRQIVEVGRAQELQRCRDARMQGREGGGGRRSAPAPQL